jgi:hypothetical protein
MTNFQRGYGEILPDWVPPDEEYLTEKEAKRKSLRAFRRGMILGAAVMAAGIFAAEVVHGQGYYRCEPPDRITIADDGHGRAIVTYYNSVNDCSNNIDRIMESENGIAVRVVITVGGEDNEYRETITLEPQDPTMMAFPPEGDLLDGEEKQFVIQGGLS